MLPVVKVESFIFNCNIKVANPDTTWRNTGVGCLSFSNLGAKKDGSSAGVSPGLSAGIAVAVILLIVVAVLLVVLWR